MNDGVTLLVEDNQDDADLTAMAFREAKIRSPLVRVKEGEEALDYLFARGPFHSRNPLDLLGWDLLLCGKFLLRGGFLLPSEESSGEL